MKLLCFQAKRFWWKAFSQTLPGIPPRHDEGEVRAAVVIFVHAEEGDEEAERRLSVLRQTVKHVKWLAHKRSLGNVVLHSFTHLGGRNSTPQFAESFLNELAERLRGGGYHVDLTPFGHFCEWDLSVYAESLAKVWKEL
ncbi:MAG: threonyl-tRNA synthetase editing domain-containing protein [Candidatus Binatia bacterium]